MNFLEILEFALMVVQSGALLGTLIYGIKGFKERQNADEKKSLLTQGLIYFAIFIVLTVIRFPFYG